MDRLSSVFVLALRNLTRHTGRTVMVLASIAFGVVALILSGGFIEDTIVEVGESMIRSSSGHLQVTKAGYATHGAQNPEKYLIDDPERLRESLARKPGVHDVLLRLSFSGLLGNGRADAAILGDGVEPAREERLGTYLTIAAGRHLQESDRYGIMIGQGVARTLKLSPGDPVTLLVNTTAGAANFLEFEIVGVFQTFSKDYDARAVRIPLPAAQELLETSGAHTAVLLLAATDDTERMATTLASDIPDAGLEVRTWVELNEFYTQTVELYRQQFGFLSGIILTMLVLSVVNAVNMSAFERLGEFGTMLALGNRPRQIFDLIVAEGVILGLIGSALGVAIGIVLAVVISSIGIPMPPPPNAEMGYTSRILVVPWTIALSFVVGVAATFLASLLPARRISRTPVCEALRHAI